MLGHISHQPRRAGQASGLRANRVDTADHHVIDLTGVDAGAIDQCGDHGGAKVGGMHLGEAATSTADRRPHRIHDVHRFTFSSHGRAP